MSTFTAKRGDRYGRYEVRGELGSGGMSVVARAVHVDRGHDVALKIVNPLFHHTELVDRLRREEHILRSLRDVPGLVNVFEYLEGDARAPHVLVLEYLDGQTLRDRTAEPFAEADIPQALAWFRQVAETLGQMHDAGVVHRDVKPENVFLESNGRARVIDLNSAGPGRGKGRGKITEHYGNAPHTSAYLSPRCVGGLQPMEEDDLYALVMTFAEIIAQQHPLSNGDREILPGEWKSRQTSARRPKLSTLRPDLPIPPSLDRMVDRGISASPQNWYRDAGELLEAIAEVQADWGQKRRPRVESTFAIGRERPDRTWMVRALLVATGTLGLGLAGLVGLILLVTDAPLPRLPWGSGAVATPTVAVRSRTAYPLAAGLRASSDPGGPGDAFDAPLLVPHAVVSEQCVDGAGADCAGGARWVEVRRPSDGARGWLSASRAELLAHRHALEFRDDGSDDRLVGYCSREDALAATRGAPPRPCVELAGDAAAAARAVPMPVVDLDDGTTPDGQPARLYEVMVAAPHAAVDVPRLVDDDLAERLSGVAPSVVVAPTVWIVDDPRLHDVVLITREEGTDRVAELRGHQDALATGGCVDAGPDVWYSVLTLLVPGVRPGARPGGVSPELERYWATEAYGGQSILRVAADDIPSFSPADCRDFEGRLGGVADDLERRQRALSTGEAVIWMPFTKVP